MSRLHATYRLKASGERAEQLARRIAYEQTVELPEALVTDAKVLEHVVGRVERLVADSDDDAYSIASISYSAALAEQHLSQLLNVLFGNASIFAGVRVVELQLPDTLLQRFRGPRHGIAGLRELVGVHARPLLATALKPQGIGVDRLAALAGGFALGGGDLVKDDQNLIDDFVAFRHRVTACRQAVERANDRTGRRCLYLPHVSATGHELERYLDFVALSGLPGVLLCPLVLGLETVRAASERYDFVVMAHPGLSGGFTGFADRGGGREDHGIAQDVLLGTLFRMAGADISIFPNYGGRFSYTRAQCLALRSRLQEKLGELAPAWPCPAGGMDFDRLGDLCADYGEDSVLLIGGSLLAHHEDIETGTRAFAGAIAERHATRLSPPRWPPAPDTLASAAGQHFAVQPGFEWTNRPSSPYKNASDDSFKGVRRVELVGKYGEQTRTDLRYFEVEPGGFSSHEKHLHTHIIIGARGAGTLLLGNESVQIHPRDVAYIEPLQTHQLRNDGDEPFGFFCVVDHARDRPMRA